MTVTLPRADPAEGDNVPACDDLEDPSPVAGAPTAARARRSSPAASGTAGAATHGKRKAPPKMPKSQLVVVLMIQFLEAVQINILFPFVVWYVSDLGHAGKENGTYVGALTAAFCLSQFASSWAWGRLSDVYGRRKCLCAGMCGAMVSSLVFGTATTYAQAMLARVVGGLLSGNVGVLKSLLAAWTANCDAQERAQAFGLLPMAWGIGCVVAPLVGGLLARPALAYPSVDWGIFETLPYLLPMLTVVGFQVVTVIASLLVLHDPSQEPPLRGLERWWARVTQSGAACSCCARRCRGGRAAYSRVAESGGDVGEAPLSSPPPLPPPSPSQPVVHRAVVELTRVAASAASGASAMETVRASRRFSTRNLKADGAAAARRERRRRRARRERQLGKGSSDVQGEYAVVGADDADLSSGLSDIDLSRSADDDAPDGRGDHSSRRLGGIDASVETESVSSGSSPERSHPHAGSDDPASPGESEGTSTGVSDVEVCARACDNIVAVRASAGAGTDGTEGTEGGGGSGGRSGSGSRSDVEAGLDLDDRDSGRGADGDGDGGVATSVDVTAAVSPGHEGDTGFDDTSVDEEDTRMRSARELLADPGVMRSCLLYGLMAYIYVSFEEAFPLLAAVPVEHGGLGFDQRHIGAFVALSGILLMVYTSVILPRITARVRTFTLLRWGVASSIAVFTLFPVTNYVAALGSESLLWVVLVATLVVKQCAGASAFLCVMLIVNQSGSGRELGAVNGIGQSFAALARAIGPALGGFLWSASLHMESWFELHDFVLFSTIGFMNFIAWVVAMRLPEHVEPEYKLRAQAARH